MLRLDLQEMTADEAYQLLYEALEARRQTFMARINDVRALLGEKPQKARQFPRRSISDGAKRGRPFGSVNKPAKSASNPAKPAPGTHRMSQEARQRIIDAQKKRWAKHHREQKAKERATKEKKAAKTSPRPKGMRLDLAQAAIQ